MKRRSFVPMVLASVAFGTGRNVAVAGPMCLNPVGGLLCALGAFIVRRSVQSGVRRGAANLATRGTPSFGATASRSVAISNTARSGVTTTTVTREALSMRLSGSAILALPVSIVGVSPAIASLIEEYDTGEIWIMNEQADALRFTVEPQFPTPFSERIRVFMGYEIVSKITNQILAQRLVTVYCDPNMKVEFELSAPVLDKAGPVSLKSVAYKDPRGREADERFVLEDGHDIIVAHPSEIDRIG
jgi:hypothetical protein